VTYGRYLRDGTLATGGFFALNADASYGLFTGFYCVVESLLIIVSVVRNEEGKTRQSRLFLLIATCLATGFAFAQFLVALFHPAIATNWQEAVMRLMPVCLLAYSILSFLSCVFFYAWLRKGPNLISQMSAAQMGE